MEYALLFALFFNITSLLAEGIILLQLKARTGYPYSQQILLLRKSAVLSGPAWLVLALLMQYQLLASAANYGYLVGIGGVHLLFALVSMPRKSRTKSAAVRNAAWDAYPAILVKVARSYAFWISLALAIDFPALGLYTALILLGYLAGWIQQHLQHLQFQERFYG